MNQEIVPKSVREWAGMFRFTQAMNRDGFLIPMKFVRFTAAKMRRKEAIWAKQLIGYGEDYLRSGGRLAPDHSTCQNLDEINYKLVTDARIRNEIFDAKEEWKREESLADSRWEEGWIDRKVHLFNITRGIARQNNFAVTPEGYFVDFADLRLSVTIDKGRPNSEILQIVMYNELSHTQSGWRMMLPWEDLLPGMDIYNTGETPTQLVWGIKAYIAAARNLAASF